MKKFLKIVLKSALAVFVLLNIIVMFHAYKFTHFYEAGEVPFKAEKDKTSWEKTKSLLFGFNMAKQKNIAPDSTFKTVKLTTADGLKLDAWYVIVPNAKGSVVMFHGHGGKKSGVLKEAASFQQLGYNTLLVDFRAHGNSEGNTCTIGYEEGEDVKLGYEYLQKTGEKNIVLWGISLGAAAITSAMDKYPIAPSKVILEMPFGSLSEAVRGRVRIMGLPAEPVSTLLTFWGGVEHGFWAFKMKPFEYVKKIKCPVLLQWGKNDPRVTENETNQIFANITAKKKLVVYENSGHESLCTKEHDKWMTEVSDILQ